MTKDDASQVPVKITPERPLPRRKKGNHTGNFRRSNKNWRPKNKRYDERRRSERDRDRDQFKHRTKKRKFTIRQK